MKKKLFLLCSIIFANISVSAQNDCCDETQNLLANGDFNTIVCTSTNIFASNCVPNWSRAGGTPSITNSAINPNAWMWSANGVGEAIAGRVNFEQGVTYNICFRVETGDRNTNDPNVANNSTINLVATNNPGSVTATPNGQIVFQDIMVSYLYNWTTVTVQFTPNSD
jgi:hypothetical protein